MKIEQYYSHVSIVPLTLKDGHQQ